MYIGHASKQVSIWLPTRVITPHAQHEWGKVIDRGVHIYIYIYIYMSMVEKKFESYFRDRLTFSNVDSRTSRQIYRLALLLRAPETLSLLSKSRISIFNAHLTLLVRKMASHNSIGKYRHLVNWLGTCLGTERRRLQTRLVECRTGKKWISGAPLFTLVIFDFHEGRQHNIDDVCVEFCWILFFFVNLFTLVIFMKVDNISCWCLCWILLSKEIIS